MSHERRRAPFTWSVVAIVAFFCIGLPGAGAVLLEAQPEAAAWAADRARGLVGPEPVAYVETQFYRIADSFRRFRYRLSGDVDGWRPDGQAAAPAESHLDTYEYRIVATPTMPGEMLAGLSPDTTPPPAPALGPVRADLVGRMPADAEHLTDRPSAHARLRAERLSPILPEIKAPVLAGEGVWQPLASCGQPPGEPILWQTVYRPDAERPFAHVALVAMDLSRSRLHIVVGTSEPASEQPPRGLRKGVIPPEVQTGGHLLAAWNGGFKAVHGKYGMMTDGTEWLPPGAGLATVAVGKDGHVEMGSWGHRVRADGDWAAWRQNNPPLIDDGVLNPDVKLHAQEIRWGASVDGAVFIWRSGMGLSQGKRWLIYAAGNSLSVETLTRALSAAGAHDAMQLDVNATWERYFTFTATPQVLKWGGRETVLPVSAQRLIDPMPGGPTMFLLPWERDFFYLTAI